MSINVNFSEWLHRLGLKQGTPPGFVQAVQPVQIAQDASRTVSPLEYARGLFHSFDPGGTPTPLWVFARMSSTRPFKLTQQKVQHSATGTNPAAPWEFTYAVYPKPPAGFDPSGNPITIDRLRTINDTGPVPCVTQIHDGDLSTVPFFSVEATGGPGLLKFRLSVLHERFNLPDVMVFPNSEIFLCCSNVPGIGFDWTGAIVEYPNTPLP